VKLSLVILNYNGAARTLSCLDSLREGVCQAFDALVVDNGSADGSQRAIRAWIAHHAAAPSGDGGNGPRYSALSLSDNAGYAAGMNRGLEWVREHWNPDFAFLLNNDVILAPDCLAVLRAFLETAAPDTAAAGPCILYANRPDRVWSAGGRLTWYGARRDLYQNRAVEALPERPYRVGFLSGCAVCLSLRWTARYGMLDEDFFFGEEDHELARRIRRTGHRCVVVPAARLRHAIGASRARSGHAAYGEMLLVYLAWILVVRKSVAPVLYRAWRFAFLAYVFVARTARRNLSVPRAARLVRDLARLSGCLCRIDAALFARLMRMDEDDPETSSDGHRGAGIRRP
jgi:GT2 family glycosyltransferase